MIDIDIIGTLVDPGAHDAEGQEISPPVVHEGWHANILPEGLAERPELAAHVVEPSHYRRVWFGREGETVALRFADEAEGLSVLGPVAGG